MNVKPRIFHYTEFVVPFTAVTITEIEGGTWSVVKDILVFSLDYVNKQPYNKATNLQRKLEQYAISGVAICDKRDQFNRQRGHIIAKGRLLKHLRKE
jgi:hypothetical protein